LADTHDDDVTSRPGRGRRLVGVARRHAPLAFEVLALSAFVVARPVLASFGRSPESFLARGADWFDVIAFGLFVVLAPAAMIVGAVQVVGLLGEHARRRAHLVAVGGLAALASWQVLEGPIGRPRVAVVVAVAVAVAVATLRARRETAGTFLRYASVGALVFLLQFLVLSPASSIALGGRHAGAEVRVGDQLGDDPPPVVLVVLDGLSTGMLMDGDGHIDSELYPNLAALADDATWYRNHTTVAQVTLDAVPAILTGTLPSPNEDPPVASTYPHSIFTLLADTHEVHGAEAITGVCPVDLCPAPTGTPLGALAWDAARIWEWQMRNTTVDPELVPHAFDERVDRASRWFTDQDYSQGERPGLFFYHVLLPHPGWDHLADGSEYAAARGVRPSGLFTDSWGTWGTNVARQRHVLQTQAADRLLGELLDRLEEDDVYDDALVAVTADHGYAFVEDSPWRALDEGNVDEILWTPLIVKAPGQDEPVIDDSNVNATDVLPTIATTLGIDELPWDVDGEPAGSTDRDPDDKWVLDWSYGRLQATGDDHLVRIDGAEPFARVLAADPVEGTGPLAVWRRTEHGDLVTVHVDDLDVGDPADVTLEVTDLDRWDDVDADEPLIELVGLAALPSEAPVAVTVNDVVAAVVPPEASPFGIAVVHALLWPGSMEDGSNEIGAYVVEGPADAPVLHPLEVAAGPPG
jgi:hypothetical protein